jgi:hypothetical protein
MGTVKEVIFDEGDLVFYFKYLELKQGEVSQVYPKAVFVAGEIIPNYCVYPTQKEAIADLVKVAIILSCDSVID